MFAHLGGTFLPGIVPLVIYLVYKDRNPFIRGHAAQAMNFHITVYAIILVSVPLIFVFLGFFTILLAMTWSLAFTIIAAVAANGGREHTYPLTPRMIH